MSGEGKPYVITPVYGRLRSWPTFEDLRNIEPRLPPQSGDSDNDSNALDDYQGVAIGSGHAVSAVVSGSRGGGGGVGVRGSSSNSRSGVGPDRGYGQNHCHCCKYSRIGRRGSSHTGMDDVDEGGDFEKAATRSDLSAATEVGAAASLTAVELAQEIVRAVNAWQEQTASIAVEITTDLHDVHDAIERLEQIAAAASPSTVDDATTSAAAADK